MKPDDIQWSQGLFASLKDGGVWAVPRSGLIFSRKGDTLVLVSRMPYDARMPFSQDMLEAVQASDFDAISQHMAAAGVPVFDSTGITPAS